MQEYRTLCFDCFPKQLPSRSHLHALGEVPTVTMIRKVLPLFLLMLLADWSAQAATWTTVDVPGATYTAVLGINSNGDMVGQYVDDSNNSHGFLLTSGIFTIIDVPGASVTGPWDINDAGQISGSFWGPDGLAHGFVFDGQQYTTLDFPGAMSTVARGINNAGEVVGYYDDFDGTRHGFTWSNGNYETVDVNSKRTLVYGLNNRGAIVGSFGGHQQFVRNPQGKIRKFFSPGAHFTDINDHKIVVGYTPRPEGFRLDLKTNKTSALKFPGSVGTLFYGINSGGQIVGQYYDGTKYHGFVRTP